MTDIKSCIELSTTRGDRVYTFNITSGAPWGELFDASHEIHNKVIELVKEGIQKTLAQKDSNAGDETKD
jgi:hypothetical protein